MRGIAALLGALFVSSPCACGARTGLGDGGGPASNASNGTGLGGTGGAGETCAAGPCMKPSHPGDPVWNALQGITGQQAGASVAFDAAGNTLVAGDLYGADSIDFGCGPLSEPIGQRAMFVTKLDRCHHCLFSHRFEHIPPTTPTSAVAVRVKKSGDVVILANAGSESFVTDLDKDGQSMWEQTLGPIASGGGTSQAIDIAVDSSDDVLLAASFTGTVSLGAQSITSPAGAGTFVAKLDSSGTPKWVRTLDANALLSTLTTDGSGNAVFTGIFETPIDFGCGVLQGKPNNVVQAYATELGPDGQCRWSKWFHNSDVARGAGVATNAHSDVVVTGSFSGTIDLGGGPIQSTGAFDNLYVGMLGPDGEYLWGKAFANAIGGLIVLNDSGESFFEGLSLHGEVDFGGGPLGGTMPIFLASLGPKGEYRWAKGFGDKSTSSSTGAIALDSFSHVLVAGGIGGTIDLGCGAQKTAAEADVFLAEFMQ